MAQFSSVRLSSDSLRFGLVCFTDRLRANYAPGVHDTGAETTNLLEICCTKIRLAESGGFGGFGTFMQTNKLIS